MEDLEKENEVLKEKLNKCIELLYDLFAEAEGYSEQLDNTICDIRDEMPDNF